MRSALVVAAVGAGTIFGLDALVTGRNPLLRPPASLKVKVTYFQMPQLIGGTSVAEEYFVLQSPADLSDLLEKVMSKHPPISAMVPTMSILVNGVTSQPSTRLSDGAEVDLMPIYAGG